LGEDIARALGTVGHLLTLRRVQTGLFGEAQCITLAALESMTEAERLACIRPIDTLLSQHMYVTLEDENTPFFLRGMRRRITAPNATEVAVFDQTHTLLGTAHIEDGALIPIRLLSGIEFEEVKTQQKHELLC
jgi:tRNA pseudouridine55 synthase